jgi:hypothetical protein
MPKYSDTWFLVCAACPTTVPLVVLTACPTAKVVLSTKGDADTSNNEKERKVKRLNRRVLAIVMTVRDESARSFQPIFIGIHGLMCSTRTAGAVEHGVAAVREQAESNKYKRLLTQWQTASQTTPY